MGSLHETNPSYWVGTATGSEYPRYQGGGADIDVAVIGAGITGLTTAVLLADAGARVAVLEAGRIASGVTGYTTAKVTSLHGKIYSQLVQSHGEDAARLYGEANAPSSPAISRSSIPPACSPAPIPSGRTPWRPH